MDYFELKTSKFVFNCYLEMQLVNSSLKKGDVFQLVQFQYLVLLVKREQVVYEHF